MYLYHEKQDAGLCGVHALNNLLQGPYYSEVDLMQIAQSLDADEKNLMAEQGVDTLEFIRYVAEDSSNVALDGNFSIEVLNKALRSFGLYCTPITHPDMKHIAEDPTGNTSAIEDKWEVVGVTGAPPPRMGEFAFLCNLSSHWFGIRKIQGHFWDLNSLLKKPNHLGELYLGVFLKQLQAEGYSIFVVTGTFPFIRCNPEEDRNWTYVPLPSNKNKNKEDEELLAALEASLLSTDDLDRAIQASLTLPPPSSPQLPGPSIVLPPNNSINNNSSTSNNNKATPSDAASAHPSTTTTTDDNDDMNDELQAALAFSIQLDGNGCK